jgi:hypothetical protein
VKDTKGTFLDIRKLPPLFPLYNVEDLGEAVAECM